MLYMLSNNLFVACVAVCGDYDPTYQMCCAGNVQYTVHNNDCCGMWPYNNNLDICCDGRIFTSDTTPTPAAVLRRTMMVSASAAIEGFI